jgi:hypothetical protein
MNRYTVLPEVKLAKTQVLPDMELMVGGLEKMQYNYDKTADALKGTSSQLGSLELYGEAAKKYSGALNEVFQQKASEMLTKDLGSGEVMSEVNSFISQISSDSELNKHIAAKKVADKYLTQVGDLKKAGKYHWSNSYQYDKAWEHYSKTGQYHPGLETAIVEEGVNAIDELPKYFAQLTASGSDAIGYLSQQLGGSYSDASGTVNDTSQLKLAYKNTYRGISSTQVQQQANNVFSTFVNSNLGRQTARDYDALVDQKRLDPKGTTKEQYLMGTLLGGGLGKVHSITSTNMDAVQREGEHARFKQAKADETMEGVLSSGPEVVNMKNLDFDTKGKLKLSSRNGLGDRLMDVVKGKRNVGDLFNGDNRGEIEEIKTHANILAYAKANGITDAEAATLLSAQGNPAPKYKVYTDAGTRKNLTDLWYSSGAGIYSTMNYIDTETGKTVSMKDVLNHAIESGATSLKGEDLNTDSPTGMRKAVDALGIQAVGKAQGGLYTANGVVIAVGQKNYIADISYGGTVNTSKEQKQAHIAENIRVRGGYVDPKTGNTSTIRVGKDGKAQAITLTLEELYSGR